MTKPSWTGHGQTDIGPLRKENQDSLTALDQIGVWCVADGMGGHKEGGIASHLATQSLEGLQRQQFTSIEQVAQAVKDTIHEVNQSLCAMSSSFYEQEVIGTTIVILIIHGRQAKVLWVGDSRLYRMRDLAFELMTEDHTQFQELANQGVLEMSNSGHPSNHMLTRALGASAYCEIEELDIELGDSDIFMMCSDGLSNIISQLEMAKIIYYSEDKNRAVANLINMAIAKQATDNVTALIVDKEGA
ncbi:serine/threonine-protein phosphatase [Marinomonas rhizomae]|uniref:PP2C family protein-serine/threonine phosphatase n=1 Tax=Marinomonas rhizomae TaxID=491948 RepID=UPI002104677E|nr:PP2C family serine/threonine-protein phosphatase [Marinomonas rhizomae]UTV99818.1 serine/threonine-protein phosphatase [Marinomonas rhizomae]